MAKKGKGKLSNLPISSLWIALLAVGLLLTTINFLAFEGVPISNIPVIGFTPLSGLAPFIIGVIVLATGAYGVGRDVIN